MQQSIISYLKRSLLLLSNCSDILSILYFPSCTRATKCTSTIDASAFVLPTTNILSSGGYLLQWKEAFWSEVRFFWG